MSACRARTGGAHSGRFASYLVALAGPAGSPNDLLARWQQDVQEFLRHDAPRIAGIVVVAVILLQLLQLVTRRLERYGRAQLRPSHPGAQQMRTLAGILHSVGIAIILFLAGLEVLTTLGINIGPLLASAGIAGLAIGFGAQTLVKDVINGFFILLENQYDLGDTVRLAGVQGSVEAMTLRRTVLRDADGALHSVPNSEIKVVSNLTRDWAQVALHVAVAYSEPSDKVLELLAQVGREVRDDPAFAAALVAAPEVPGIERVAGGEVDYLMLTKTKPGEQQRVSRELRRRIKECLERNHVQAARPAQVYVVEADGGRSGPARPA